MMSLAKPINLSISLFFVHSEVCESEPVLFDYFLHFSQDRDQLFLVLNAVDPLPGHA